MEPLMVSNRLIDDLAVDLVQAAGALSGAVTTGGKQGIVELLRIANSYYSNLIEGHHTRPADIERAMHDDFDTDPKKKDLQKEAKAHIEIQRDMEAKIEGDPSIAVTSPAFLKGIHQGFYERVPKDLRHTVDPETGKKEEVVPGEFRKHLVQVGRHFPPQADSIDGMMHRFAEAYDPARLSRVGRVIAFATSHHRLMWIHPFLDGNGRVARLYSSAYARRAGLEGEGLWSISRGLARARKEYYSQLAGADAVRHSDTDGRGALSEKALSEFAEFFLRTAIDQVNYMRDVLQPTNLSNRVRAYSELRRTGALKMKEALVWKPEMGLVLESVAVRGELSRTDIQRLTGFPERTARRMTQALVKDGLLESDSSRTPFRLGFPAHAVGVYFPNLYPEGVDWK